MNFEAFAWYVETGVEIFPGLVRLPLRDRTGGRIVEDAGALRPIRLVREFLIGVSATQRHRQQPVQAGIMLMVMQQLWRQLLENFRCVPSTPDGLGSTALQANENNAA